MRHLLVLSLAATALSDIYLERSDDYEYVDVPTIITYTTVTTCPVTSTYTEDGTTYCVTDLTTSTVTVTECTGCNDQLTTVPGPVVMHTITEEVEVTYTSLCPVTETVTGPKETYVTTYTVPNTVITHIPTIIYETVPGEHVTRTHTEVEYSTVTIVYPVTKVATIEGEEHTVTLTTTEIFKTVVPSHVYLTVHESDDTVTVTKTAESTYTTIYPVTFITTVDGEEYTVTHTRTQILHTAVPSTVVLTVSHPGLTVSETEVHWITKTTIYTVTQTTDVSGSHITSTYHVTETTVEEDDTTPTATAGYPPVETPEAPPAESDMPSEPPVAAGHNKRTPFIGLIVAMVGALTLL